MAAHHTWHLAPAPLCSFLQLLSGDNILTFSVFSPILLEKSSCGAGVGWFTL